MAALSDMLSRLNVALAGRPAKSCESRSFDRRRVRLVENLAESGSAALHGGTQAGESHAQALVGNVAQRGGHGRGRLRIGRRRMALVPSRQRRLAERQPPDRLPAEESV